MNTSAYIVTALAFCSLLGALAGAVRWMVKSYLAELKPNGGSSMKDSINRLEARVDDLFRLLADKK
jgi:hypothetical protein